MPSPSGTLVRQLLWVFLAGGAGACARYWLVGVVDARLAERLPHVGTLLVNMVGCLLIGIAAAMMPPGIARGAVVGGLLGGFTTYSSFALFSVDLLHKGRPGAMLAQVGLHLVLGVLFAAAGLWLGRALGGEAGAP